MHTYVKLKFELEKRRRRRRRIPVENNTMTVRGEVYIRILKMTANIPTSMDLDLVSWRKVSVTKMTIATNITSIIKAIIILR